MTIPQPPREPEVPTPAEPDPVPAEPAPVPVEPEPYAPPPAEPIPYDPPPVPTEPIPTEPVPTEPVPTEPVPAEPPPIPPAPVPPAYEPPAVEPAPAEAPAPHAEVVDSFVAEPPVAAPVDPTPEVPQTLADEPPAPAASQVPVDDPLPVVPGTPEAPPAYADAGEAAPVAAAPATDVVPPATPPATRRRSRAWLPMTAVAVAVALLAGATGFLSWQLWQQRSVEDGRPDAVAAARDAARLLFSYNHATLDDDFAKGLAVTTGGFREEYSRTTKEVVTPVAREYKAVVVAEVVEAAVIDSEPGEVTALVFLNQGTTSTRVEGQQVDQSRVRMHLVERDGEWLVEAVEAL